MYSIDHFVPVTIQNTTNRILYMAIQRVNAKGKSLWLSVRELSDGQIPDGSWVNFDGTSCNLIISPQTEKSFYYSAPPNHDATMYLSAEPLQGRPDFHSALFIYDQIEISSQLDKLAPDIEPTWHLHWMLSNHDFFGLPLQLEFNEQMVGFENEICRSTMLSALSKIDAPFNQYKIPKNYDLVYRWFSPAKQVLNNIWKKAIAQGLSALDGQSFSYQDTQKTISCEFKYVSEDSIAVKEVTTREQQETINLFVLNNINTIAAIRGTISPREIVMEGLEIASEISPEEETSSIQSGAFIAAAINRGVLYDTSLWNQEYQWAHQLVYEGNYYRTNKYNCGQFNTYSKVIHEHQKDYKGIGFCYDEYFIKGPKIIIPSLIETEAALIVKILPF